MSTSSEIVDRLKSLSIDRSSDALAHPTGITDKKRRLPVGSLLLSVAILGAAGIAVGVGPSPGATLDWTRTAIAEYMGTDARPVPASTPAATPTPVVTEKAPIPAAAPDIIGSGHVVADRQLELMPDIGGRIADVLVETGSSFEAGQVIATLDATGVRADLEIAQANLAMAKADHAALTASLDEARSTRDAQARLRARGLVPEVKFEAARYAQLRIEREGDVAAQKITVARLEVAKARDVLARHTIRAPFGGVVVARHLNPGDTALSAMDGGPEAAIATLIDPGALSIEVDIAETSLKDIMVGQPAEVTLDAFPNQSFAATVTTIAPVVSVQKGTAHVRLSFDHPPMGVFANMAAKVTLDPNTQTAALARKGH